MSQQFPHIPQRLLNYRSEKLIEAFEEQGEVVIWLGVDTLFQIVSEITRLDSEALLSRLGFDEKNQDRNSLQSLFGVMRVIVMLRDLGFTDITPLPPRQDRKEADLLATRNGELIAVEVFRANEDRWRCPGSNLEVYIGKRFRLDKKAQLDATMAEYNCTRAILAVVFDSESKAWLDKGDLQDSVVGAFAAMGLPDRTHLLVFAGTPDAVTGEDDLAVYPEFLP